MLPSANLQRLQTSLLLPWQSSSIYTQTHTEATLRFPLANSEVNPVLNSLVQELFGFDLQTLYGTLRNQTPLILESRWSFAKGRCTFDRKCTKFITVTFSTLGHMIYSVVFMFPNYSWCLFVRLQKLPLELSVLIKYRLFLNCYIYSLTPVCNELHRIIGTSKA